MIGQLLKSVLTCLLLLTSILPSFAQFRYDVILGPKLKGKIDSVITPSGQGKNVGIFNKKRQLVEFYEYTSVRNLQIYDTTRTVYEYDKGLLSRSISYYSRYDAGIQTRKSIDTTTWHFVKEGNIYIAKFHRHTEKDPTLQIIYKLNGAFQLIEKTDLFYATNQFYTYDKNGYLIKENRTVKRPDNTLLTDDTYYTNDADGNVIVKANKGLIFKYIYTRYDKMHNWLERNNYKLDTEDYLTGKLERRITYYK